MLKACDVNLSNGNVEEKNISDASHYALQIAIQTMKQRCERLESRLAGMEKTNRALSAELLKYQNDTKAKELINLNERIEELERQKEQLSHHIFMLGEENNKLWSRLSLVNNEKDELVKKLDEENLKRTALELLHTFNGSNGNSEISGELDCYNNDDEENKSRRNSKNEDCESDESVVTVKDSSNSPSISDEDDIDFQQAVDRIVDKLQNEKLILQRFHSDVAETFNSLRNICDEKAELCKITREGNQETSNPTSALAENRPQIDESSKERCPSCNKLMPSKIDDLDNMNLLSSFEIVMCNCHVY